MACKNTLINMNIKADIIYRNLPQMCHTVRLCYGYADPFKNATLQELREEFWVCLEKYLKLLEILFPGVLAEGRFIAEDVVKSFGACAKNLLPADQDEMLVLVTFLKDFVTG
ncbi:uncharacterized protein LOC135397457 [Ornithodoros turicata]|uniref:uncharacterized protein LOC135397457 n=1 Tax=Ornithodoros turicata TaxID=34597 RepID=UPI003138CD77